MATPLFARSFPSITLIKRQTPPEFKNEDADQIISIGSLGRHYRNSIVEFPARESYLVPDADIVRAWKNKLAAQGDGLKVGISWKGGTAKTRREQRSIPLALWEPILNIKGASFFSLQYGDATPEIETFNRNSGAQISYFPPQMLDDFDQVAGLVTALDLVISVQTTIVHLCGAIGHPCWAMVHKIPEWRYGLNDRKMPWYRSVDIFRQSERDQWGDVIRRVASDLENLAAKA